MQHDFVKVRFTVLTSITKNRDPCFQLNKPEALKKAKGWTRKYASNLTDAELFTPPRRISEETERFLQATRQDGGVHEVAIKGDGDCFYTAIVEAFKRQGIDIADLPEAEVKIFNKI